MATYTSTLHNLVDWQTAMERVHRIIPLTDLRSIASSRVATGYVETSGGVVLDQLKRPLRDLRISVTDRCNFRCSYCMPKEVFDKNYHFLPNESLLSFEEILRLAGQFVAQGVRKIRLTGGEPLLRKNVETLIEQLAKLRTPEGLPVDLTLTTNGALLAKKAKSLHMAGLQRITVSLDALSDTTFRRMNGVGFPVADVLEGLSAAHREGLSNIKVNMVVKKGTNDHEVLPMARHFRGSGFTLRFIEYMDVGSCNGWRMDEVLSSAGVLGQLQSEMPLIQLAPNLLGETAERWGYSDELGLHDPSLGEIGLISSVSKAFCGDCNRARLSTEGKLYLCLFAGAGHDLKRLLRQPYCLSDEELRSVISSIWKGRSDRYSELRKDSKPGDKGRESGKVEMSYIGG